MHDHREMIPVMDEIGDLVRLRAKEHACPHCRALLAGWLANLSGIVIEYIDAREDPDLYTHLMKFNLEVTAAVKSLEGEIGYGEDATTTH